MKFIPAGVEWHRTRGNESIAIVRQKPEVVYEASDFTADEMRVFGIAAGYLFGDPRVPAGLCGVLFGKDFWL